MKHVTMNARHMWGGVPSLLLHILIAVLVITSLPFGTQTAHAAASLTVTPITWNVIGLDSNNVTVGPNDFPVGVRVCNTGDEPAANLSAKLVWDSSNPYIDTRPGTSDTLTLLSLSNTAPNHCADFYFEVEVARDSNAYDTVRQYHIEVTADNGVAASSPSPRELYVEHLVSQNRNAVTDVQLNGTSITTGGTMTLMVGSTYTIKLIGYTATQGYNQLESFINFPNTVFQILSVTSTYSAGASPTSRLYADACGWDSDPASATYRSCIVSDDKSGGNVTVTYQVKILSAGSTNPGALNTLLYDFSGSSYHYNSDFGTSMRYAYVVDPTSVNISKSFFPDTTSPGGGSTLTFTLTNSAPVTIGGVNFVDDLPLLSGGQMVVASPAAYSTSGCGTPSFAPSAGADSISFSNGTIAASGSCTISVGVTIPSAPISGTYHNVSENLFVGQLDSGHNAVADLQIGSSSSGSGVCDVTLAQWNFNAFTANPPPMPSPSTQASDVSTAVISVGNGLTAESDTSSGGGNPQPSILTYGWPKNGPIVPASSPYIQFAIDTSKYTKVALKLDAQRKANGPDSDSVYYSLDGINWVSKGTFNSTTSWASYGPFDFTGQASTSGVTYFRIYGFGANATSSGNDISFDNILFTGCGAPQQPTLTKSFAPDPVVVGGTSVLTFHITNPNATSLTGLAFTDVLPSGLTVANSGPTSVCNGSVTTTAPSTISFSGGTLAGNNAHCDIAVTVTAATAGPHANISGFISSSEGGTNSGPGGSATDSLTAVLPPVIDKYFDPDPILPGGVSTLVFVITNPNPSDALPNIAFTDTFPNVGGGAPSNMLVANPANPTTNGCGSPTFAPVSGTGSISFSGGTIAAGDTCIVTVDVTAPTVGDYLNTSGPVTTTISGVTSGTDTASSTLTVKPPSPGITLVKQVSTSASGPWSYYLSTPSNANVYYRFVIENIGDVPLDLTAAPVTDIVPSVDALLSGCSWGSPLPVASPTTDPTETCVVGPVTSEVGTHPNTAAVTGSYNSTPYTDTASASYLGVDPPVVTKSFAPKTVDAGTSSTMTITIENPASNAIALTGVAFTDSLPSGLEVADPPNATNTCGGTLTALHGTTSVQLSGATVAANTTCVITVDITATAVGPHLNTVTVTTSNGGSSQPASDTLTAQAVAGPAFTLTKLADVSTVDAANDIITYTITVTNTGNVNLTGIAVSDPMLADLDCDGVPGLPLVTSGLSIAVDSHIDCTGTYTVTQDDIDTNGGEDGTIDNTVTASAAEVEGSLTDFAHVDILQNPSFTIVKDSDVGSVDAADDVIHYTITVTNTGNMTLTGVSVSDPLLADLDCDGAAGLPYVTSGFSIPVGAALTCGGSYKVLQEDIDTYGGGSGTIDNTATATTEQAGSKSDSQSVLLTQTSSFTLTKSANVASVSAASDLITYTIVFENTGNTTLTGVSVSDPLLADLDCDGAAGEPFVTTGFVVQTGGSLTCSGTYSVTQEDIDTNGNGDGKIDNTATGSATDVPSQDTSKTVDINQDPKLTITKSVTSNGPYHVEDVITYNIVVENTGNVTLTGVTVTDPGAVLGVCIPAIPATLAPGDSLTCPASYSVTAEDLMAGSYNNTAAADSDQTPPANEGELVDFIVADLQLTKTVDNPSPYFGSNVVFTITVTNLGPDEATGVQVEDVLPSGFSFVSANASQGSFTSGSGVWQIGSLALNQSETLEITATVRVNGSHTNTAQVTASDQVDPNSVPDNSNADENDQASATVTPVQNDPDKLLKELVGSDHGFTSDPSVAIGEVLLYQVSLNVPPGIFPAAALDDTLPSGLSFVDCAGINATGLTTDLAEGFLSACSNPTVASFPTGSVDPVDIGRRVTFELGTLTNPDTTDHSLTVTYHVIVLDIPSNVDGTSLVNSVSFRWQGGELGPQTTDVQIVEPSLTLSKSANTGLAVLGSQVTFTLTMQHLPDSNADAFDVILVDALPPELQYVSGSLDCTSGGQDPDVDCSFDGVNTIRAEWSAFSLTGGAGVVRFSATILSFPSTGSITNTGVATWTSLPGDQTAPVTQNPYSHERFYDPNAPADLYSASDTLILRAVGGLGKNQGPTIPATGFPKGRVTVLPGKPTTYDSTGGIVLDVPALKLKVPVVGVPIKNLNWNIDWLTNQAGWLEGTAFPGLNGNSVLTGHATTPYGVSGPFAKLNQLVNGDKIFIHNNGTLYIYEVRATRSVLPNDMTVFQHETTSWITLITCSDYDAKTGVYLKRFIVRAVLIETRAE